MNNGDHQASLLLIKARKHLRSCAHHLYMAHLINDTLEGHFGTKGKPSEEWNGQYTQDNCNSQTIEY